MSPSLIHEALKVAARSSLYKYKTGAIIVRDNKIISRGWSHYSDRTFQTYLSVHAELHAVMRAAGEDLSGCTIYVVTLSFAGNVTTGRPCAECARILKDAGVVDVIYSDKFGYERINLNDQHQFKVTRIPSCQS